MHSQTCNSHNLIAAYFLHEVNGEGVSYKHDEEEVRVYLFNPNSHVCVMHRQHSDLIQRYAFSSIKLTC